MLSLKIYRWFLCMCAHMSHVALCSSTWKIVALSLWQLGHPWTSALQLDRKAFSDKPFGQWFMTHFVLDFYLDFGKSLTLCRKQVRSHRDQGQGPDDMTMSCLPLLLCYIVVLSINMFTHYSLLWCLVLFYIEKPNSKIEKKVAWVSLLSLRPISSPRIDKNLNSSMGKNFLHALVLIAHLYLFSLTSTRKGGFGSTTYRTIHFSKKDDPYVPGISHYMKA